MAQYKVTWRIILEASLKLAAVNANSSKCNHEFCILLSLSFVLSLSPYIVRIYFHVGYWHLYL